MREAASWRPSEHACAQPWTARPALRRHRPARRAAAGWGLDDDLAGLEKFTRVVVEALADRVAVLKPQIAFYERFGSAGLAVLERVDP